MKIRTMKNAPALGLAAAMGLGFLLSSTDALAQRAEWPRKDVPYAVDTGLLMNGGNAMKVVWSEIIEVPDVISVRLFFSDLMLSWNPDTLEGSILRITSLTDGAVQHLNALSAEQWANSSAYFNGNAVQVELLAAPDGKPNRVVLQHVEAGLADDSVGIASICGNADDRQLSYSDRSGRLSSGCTAWIFDDSNHQFLTAGHCGARQGVVVEFNVPLSNSNGSLNHPGPEDQYPIDGASVQSVNGGIGNDWAYFACFPNTETGLTAYQAQGDYHVLADRAPSVNGQDIRITGYGTVSSPVSPTWQQVQKTHVGPYMSLSGTTVRYRPDTTGGNSGSAVWNETDGEAIGIHSHAGCNSWDPNSANQGTAIHNSGLQNALLNPRGLAAPFSLTVSNLSAGQNVVLEADDSSSAAPGKQVYFAYSVRGEGSTHLADLGVTMGLQSPVLIGSTFFDGSGYAPLSARVPSGAQGRAVWFQAVRAGRVSEVASGTVQ